MIKNFKEFQHLQESLNPSKFLTPEQIEWCNNHIEGEWSVNDKGEVTINRDVKFKDKTFERFEVQFTDTNYNFDCSGCTKLTTLEGAPQIVKNFSCEGCTGLTTLEGAPQKVEDFDCRNCTKLTTLEGAPQEVKYNFYCDGCTGLTTLEGAPQEVDYFYCEGCTGLTSLQGAPLKVEDFDCRNCTKLTTLEGAPQEVKYNFYCEGCTGLTSLQGAPQEVDYFYYDDCPIDPEEVNLLKEDPELFKKWLASGTSFKEWKEKKRGMIIGKKYGL